MMDFQPDEKIAKFNEGFYKVYRISKLKETCHDARLFRDFRRWFTCLQGIRSEIHAKLNSKQRKEDKEKLTEREIADQYETAVNLYLDGQKEETVSIGNFQGRVENLNIYNVLYSYELWLEDMKDKYKLGMPDEDSAMTALR